MKIAHILGSLGPGGAEKLVVDLLPAIQTQGAEVELWVLSRAVDLPGFDPGLLGFEASAVQYLQKAGVRVRFAGKRPQKDRLKAYCELNRFCSAFGPAVIHAHLEDVAFHATIALSWRRIPVVQTIHNTRIDRPRLLQTLHRATGANLVCISRSSLDVVRGLGYPALKVRQISNATVSTVRLRDDTRLRQPIRRIISVGRLTEQKNHRLLLEAFALFADALRQDGGEVPQLQLVGDGPLRGELLDLTLRLKLKDIVIFLGVRQDVSDLLDTADVFTLSSSWEGMSIALLEAMAAGLPIVVTDVGGNRETLDGGHAGLLVTPGNARELAGALTRVAMDSSLRIQLGAAAQRAASLNSMDRCASEHIALYRGLLGERE